MDALYNSIINSLGLSPVNTSLLVVIFFLVRQRLLFLETQVEEWVKRNDRVERSLIKAGIDLLEME